MSDKIYRFGEFVLDTRTRELSFQNKTLHLGSKAYEILLMLVEKRGEVVGKDEILERVWENSFVEEANLPVHIRALRGILGEKKGESRFIKTISGQGYCFVFPVEENFSKTEIAESEKQIDAEAMKLYLRGISIVESRIVSKNIKETLLRALDFFKRAIDIQTDFAPAYVGVGTIYVSLHNHRLVEPRVSENEAKKALRLAGNTGENISEIYILEGSIFHIIETDYKKAIESFTKATELNPENADGYHWLGLTYNALGDFDKAIEFAEKATNLDPTNSRRSSQLSRYYFRKRDFNKSIKHAEELLAFNPNDAPMYLLLAYNYAELNLFELALQNIDKAIEIRAIAEFFIMKAYIYAKASEREKALKLVDEILGKYEYFEIDKTFLALVHDCLGDAEKAFELLFDELKAKSPELLLIQSDFRYKNILEDERYKKISDELNSRRNKSRDI